MTIPVDVILFFLIVLGIFAYHGFKRGFWAELVWSLFILGGVLIYKPDILGDVTIRLINSVAFIFAIAFSGGIQLILSGDFSAEKLGEVMSAARDKGPFIPEANKELTLFLILLLMIFVGFLISNRIRPRKMPFLGLFVGVFNALLLGYVFGPIIAGTASLLPELSATNPVEAIFEILGSTFDIVLAPFAFVINALGAWSIVLAIIIIVVLAARNARGA
ncbi:MAG: hypothetical protein GY759_12825 [Chloroflexi bacterium]|nr:hypothetical protein [Chloroflexota bacterium]